MENLPAESSQHDVIDTLTRASEHEWALWCQSFRDFKPDVVPRGRTKSHNDDPHIAFLGGFATGYRLAMAKAVEVIKLGQQNPDNS